MPISLGLTAAFVAFICWGFGDFFMQRSVRAVGKMEALFFITIFGTIVLFPWVKNDILLFLFDFRSSIILFIAGIIAFGSAYFQFRAFEVGKLAAVEPVMSIELPITILISLLLLGEHIAWWQLTLMAGVFIGVLITSVHQHKRRWWQKQPSGIMLEAGVMLAAAGALVMAGTNITTGLASRDTSPLLTIWFIHTVIAAISFVWLVVTKSLGHLWHHMPDYIPIITPVAIFDTAAWVAYSFAVLSLPIALTIGITESYVALAAFLGLRFNGEKLERHQIIGGCLAIICSIILALFTGGA